MIKETSIQLPYGAVYFRKSNPPKVDWERDYKQAANDGINIMRHWFMWGSIETAPGVYDWEDYDQQMDLAEKNGMKVIIAEITHSLPEWMFKKHPDLLCKTVDGKPAKSQMGVSCATGGFNAGLCLDHSESRNLVEVFLRSLSNRYKNHPAILGYDVWNECNYAHDLCYCEATKSAFRKWLEKKYGDLKTMGNVWHRYSYTDWDEVDPPEKLGFYPDSFDWLDFRKVNAYDQMQFKIDVIRSCDDKNLMSAHGTAQSLDNMAVGGSDEWLSASKVETYGFTFVQSRKGAAAYKQFCAVDLTRSGARGKDFWHAEAQGGPLWLQPQLTGRSLEDGRITKPEDIRLWNLTSLAGGARGILYPRLRPLLDGPLFGAFGPYGMDGGPTPCSEMASKVAKWANDRKQKELLQAKPCKGEVGILVVPEAQTASFLLSQFGAGDNYKQMMWGSYKGFFDHNIQADFVHIDDIDRYGSIYLPYPIMLTSKSSGIIEKWVKDGGRLISEGCPGYFSDYGSAGQVQPNLGLDKVFGCSQQSVCFTPDLLGDFKFNFEDISVRGGEYVQTYQPTTGTALGYHHGEAIAVKNSYGSGQTLLIGTSPGKGYFTADEAYSDEFFKGSLSFFGVTQSIVSSNRMIKARLHQDGDHRFLWILNTSPDPQHSNIQVALDKKAVIAVDIFWNGGDIGKPSGQVLPVYIQGKEAIICSIQ